MKLVALRIADPPDRWRALGFSIQGTKLSVGGVALELGCDGSGITAWSVEDLQAEVDGLPRFGGALTPSAPETPAHSNGAIGIDQVVVLTPDFDRSARALEEAGMPLKRIRDGGGFRQGFRRLGPAILELVEARNEENRAGPARFWGLVVIVRDLEGAKAQLGELLGTPTTAVQAGRQIATVRKSAGLTTRLALMTPEPD